MPYEFICTTIEEKGYFLDLQSMHLYLGIEYGKILEFDKMKQHFRKAIELSQKYELYYQIADIYAYYEIALDTVLNEYDIDFTNKIKQISKDIRNKYNNFIESVSFNNIYSILKKEEYIYVYFALQGYTNKEIASLLKTSESHVGNVYSNIYQALGINSKAKLIEYYQNSLKKEH